MDRGLNLFQCSRVSSSDPSSERRGSLSIPIGLNLPVWIKVHILLNSSESSTSALRTSKVAGMASFLLCNCLSVCLITYPSRMGGRVMIGSTHHGHLLYILICLHFHYGGADLTRECSDELVDEGLKEGRGYCYGVIMTTQRGLDLPHRPLSASVSFCSSNRASAGLLGKGASGAISSSTTTDEQTTTKH